MHKIDSAMRLPDVPHASFGLGSVSPAGVSSGNKAPSSPLSKDREFSQLIGQLQLLPEVRGSVVEQAKVAVARGEYLTQRAVEETAASLLRREAVDPFGAVVQPDPAY